ncbi:splicing factor, CC1-like protein [Actinidia rufa]|uniref:Splicing factor, CC1-like protein n=1 Tax=Actinidia rufa TaxID=165716 RepID=A0A7J0DGN5_9ERIC|nr:splicing factor, CC1-like protein [Actinidia rufa]
MSVPMAIALSVQPLLGQPVMVKNHPKLKKIGSVYYIRGGGSGSLLLLFRGARRHYVGNLHLNMKEDQLRQALNACSQALLVQKQKLDRSGSAPSVVGNSPANRRVLHLQFLPLLVLLCRLLFSPCRIAGCRSYSSPVTVPFVDILGVPSACLSLKNMFDPKLEVSMQTSFA